MQYQEKPVRAIVWAANMLMLAAVLLMSDDLAAWMKAGVIVPMVTLCVLFYLDYFLPLQERMERDARRMTC